VSDAGYDNQTVLVNHRVDNAVVADANAVVVAAGQFDRTPGPRIVGEGVDRGADPVP
jgi:hypothetical protein